MRPGMWTSSAPGDAEDMILALRAELSADNSRIRVFFTPVAGYGDRFWIVYVGGRLLGRPWAEEGEETTFDAPVPAGLGSELSVKLEDGGDWETPYYDPNEDALEIEAATADRIRFRWAARWTLEERGDALNQLSGWSLTGLKRFSNIEQLARFGTVGRLGIVISDSGGTRTVALYAGNTLVASGSRVGDGAITLTEQNNSGVAGAVTIAYTADVVLGVIYLEARWPSSFQIHYSLNALSFPRTPEETVDDGGNMNLFEFLSAAVAAAGTYNVAVIAVSDTGVADTATTASGTVVIILAPQPPPTLAYVSGTIAATVISWTASPSPGATYNIYDSDLDEAVEMETPIAAGWAGTTYTLPTKAGQEPGTRRVLVRAVVGGVEELNCNLLAIEYSAAGAHVSPRPNEPAIEKITRAAGRTLTVKAQYVSAGEAGIATSLQLFVWALGGSANYASPDDTETLSAGVDAVKTATLSAVILADGWYYVGVRAATAGGVQDLNVNAELVFVSDDVPADVEDFSAVPARA